MTPARYGMFRSSGFKVRLQVCTDASIIVHCAGIEMGQGLHTKVAQVISSKLKTLTGVDSVAMDTIRFTNNSTLAQDAQPGTGGSTGSELSCFAAEDACVKLAATLKPFKKKSMTTWKELVAASLEFKILGVLLDPPNLEADGFYKMPLVDLAYETFGVAMCEMEIDTLTGESRVLAAHLLFDAGPSFNPAVDIGQVEGSFIMGMGQILTEGMRFDRETGAVLTDNTWTYKPPIASDVPEEFIVELVDMEGQRVDTNAAHMQNTLYSTMGAVGVTGKTTSVDKKLKSAKATGEPPLLLCLSVHAALRAAITAARGGTPAKFDKLPTPTERGSAEFVLPIPATPPVVAALCNPSAFDSKHTSPDFPYPPEAEEPEKSSCSLM